MFRRVLVNSVSAGSPAVEGPEDRPGRIGSIRNNLEIGLTPLRNPFRSCSKVPESFTGTTKNRNAIRLDSRAGVKELLVSRGHPLHPRISCDPTATPSGYGSFGRCSADAPYVPPPNGCAHFPSPPPARLPTDSGPGESRGYSCGMPVRSCCGTPPGKSPRRCPNCRHGSPGTSPLWHRRNHRACFTKLDIPIVRQLKSVPVQINKPRMLGDNSRGGWPCLPLFSANQPNCPSRLASLPKP